MSLLLARLSDDMLACVTSALPSRYVPAWCATCKRVARSANELIRRRLHDDLVWHLQRRRVVGDAWLDDNKPTTCLRAMHRLTAMRHRDDYTKWLDAAQYLPLWLAMRYRQQRWSAFSAFDDVYDAHGDGSRDEWLHWDVVRNVGSVMRNRAGYIAAVRVCVRVSTRQLARRLDGEATTASVADAFVALLRSLRVRRAPLAVCAGTWLACVPTDAATDMTRWTPDVPFGDTLYDSLWRDGDFAGMRCLKRNVLDRDDARIRLGLDAIRVMVDQDNDYEWRSRSVVACTVAAAADDSAAPIVWTDYCIDDRRCHVTLTITCANEDIVWRLLDDAAREAHLDDAWSAHIRTRSTPKRKHRYESLPTDGGAHTALRDHLWSSIARHGAASFDAMLRRLHDVYEKYKR